MFLLVISGRLRSNWKIVSSNHRLNNTVYGQR